MKKYALLFATVIASNTLVAQPSYYAEALLGKTKQESESVDSEAFALRGGFQFSDYFAFELAYQDYGSNDENPIGPPVAATPITGGPINFFGNADFVFIEEPLFIENNFSIKNKTTAFNAGVKTNYPLTEKLSVIGRLGLSRTEVEIDGQFPMLDLELVGGVLVINGTSLENISIIEKGTSLYYGLGLQYDINDHFYAGLEYDVNDVEFVDVDIDHETLSVSAGFKF